MSILYTKLFECDICSKENIDIICNYVGPVQWKVGGCIRDILLGIEPKDIDIACEGYKSFDEMIDDFILKNYEILKCDNDMMTMRCRLPANKTSYKKTKDTRREVYDFVLCREDGCYKNGRRPSNVRPASIMDDLARRDFTINAMAIQVCDIDYSNSDIEKSKYILDPFDGKKDLFSIPPILRAVGNPIERFSEDALRIMRGIRFAVKYNMDIEHDTFIAMKECARKLLDIDKNRIYCELKSCLEIDTVKTLELIFRLGLERIILYNRDVQGMQVGLLPCLKNNFKKV